MGADDVVFDALVEIGSTDGEGYALPDDGPQVVINVDEAVELIVCRLRDRGLL